MMEVILREEIKALGKAGEVVKVRPGFARNFLLPKGLAVKADTQNLKELEHHKRVVASRQSKLKKEMEVLAGQIAGLTLTIKKEAGEEDKLFGAVTAKDIWEALRKEKIPVEKKQVQLESPIKQLGETTVGVKLHADVTATLKVLVVKE